MKKRLRERTQKWGFQKVESNQWSQILQRGHWEELKVGQQTRQLEAAGDLWEQLQRSYEGEALTVGGGEMSGHEVNWVWLNYSFKKCCGKLKERN